MKKIFTLFAALAMVMSMSAVNMTGGEELYLTPNSNWLQHGDGKAPRFAIYVYGSGGNAWASMTAVEGESNLYKAVVPNGNWTNVIFCRMNGGKAANDWGNKYNQTGNLTYNGTQNWYTVKEGTWDNGGGTWALYAPEAPKSYKDITITIVANATPKIHYWDGGDKMVGTVWENLPEMTATSEANTYSCTIKDVDEAIGVKYLIKVGEVQSADQQAFNDVKVNFKDLLPQVVVQGVNNWDGTDKMTVADDYLSASITLPLIAKKYDLKLTIDGAWKGHKNENNITRAKNSSVFKNDDGNGSITADIAGDYVFTYTYANQTLTVTYPALPVKYNVTVTAENGTVTGAGEYEEGKEATLTATPAEGYEFVNWTKGEEVVSTENPYKFTVTADVALVANFKKAITTITKTFDITQEEDTRKMGSTYLIYADDDYTLRIFGYNGAGKYQDDPTTEEDAAPMLFTPDYDDALNAVVVVTLDNENNKEVMQVTATSEDGSTIYNLTINIALPSYEKYSLIATGIKAENGEVEGMPIISLKGEGLQNGEDKVPFDFMVFESALGYMAEGTVGDVYLFSTEAEFFVEDGEFNFMATMQDEESKYLFNVEMNGTMAQPEVEIVVKEKVSVVLYDLTVEVQGNMAMVSAGADGQLSFWLTLNGTENGYGTYSADAISNVWYNDVACTSYGEEQTYGLNENGVAEMNLSFINEPDEEGNVTLYQVKLLAGKMPVENPEPVDIVGVVKRALQLGESTVVLTHEADGTAHIYNVVDGDAYEVSQTGVVARDPENAGDYLAISDIALTEDGKLIAVNYIMCQSGDDYVDEGYKRGENRFYIWDNLAGDPSILFTSKMSSNWFRSKQGYTMALKGNSTNCQIILTGPHGKSDWGRFSIYNVIEGQYVEPDVNNNDYYHFHDAATDIYDNGTVGVLGENYQLNASPLTDGTWILDGNLVEPYEIIVPETNNVALENGATLSTDLGKKYNGATYVTVGEKHLMVAPYANAEGKLAGVKVLDITAGLATATLAAVADLDAAVEATAAATAVVAAEDELTVTLVADAALHVLKVDLTQGPATALDNIAIEGKTAKAIINGQLIIVKDGVQYNAQGAVVK